MITIYPEPPAGALGDLPFQPPTAPSGLSRGNWEHYQAQMTYNVAVTLGLPSLFDFKGEAKGVVVIDSLRAYGEVPFDGGKDLFGTSVALLVQAYGDEVTASTSLPAISARVQLGVASATAYTQVRGFADKEGFLATLTSETNLNVETYSHCIESLQKARDYMAAHSDQMEMAYLGRVLDLDTSARSRRAAVVEADLLRWVAREGALAGYLRRKGDALTPEDVETARSIWREVAPGLDEDASPKGRPAFDAAVAVQGLDR